MENGLLLTGLSTAVLVAGVRIIKNQEMKLSDPNYVLGFDNSGFTGIGTIFKALFSDKETRDSTFDALQDLSYKGCDPGDDWCAVKNAMGIGFSLGSWTP